MAVNKGGAKELAAYMDKICKDTCLFMSNEFYETVNFFLAQYYSEDWDSRTYQRTEALLRSAFKTTPKKTGNGWYCEVGIDYESLDDYKDATGYQVVTWANTKGIHGGLDVSSTGANTAVWDDSLESAINSGQLFRDCIDFLKGKGYKIIT